MSVCTCNLCVFFLTLSITKSGAKDEEDGNGNGNDLNVNSSNRVTTKSQELNSVIIRVEILKVKS
jgi:hypothetical protein